MSEPTGGGFLSGQDPLGSTVSLFLLQVGRNSRHACGHLSISSYCTIDVIGGDYHFYHPSPCMGTEICQAAESDC